MSAPRPIPAVLQAATETETSFGGREATWAPVATVWVSLTLSSTASAQDSAVSAPAESDTAAAVARDHPTAAPGQRLIVGDDPDSWRVRRVDRGLPGLGRMTLRLDRLI